MVSQSPRARYPYIPAKRATTRSPIFLPIAAPTSVE
jgi:hypothetical protein